MKTTLIIGAQGCGKSTLAKTLLKNPTHGNDQAASYGELALIGVFSELLAEAGRHPHTLLVDEADVFFSMLDSRERKTFKNYWALARHKGLEHAVFIARRYVQIPIFVRASATQVYISADIRPGAELSALEREGLQVERGLPRGQFIFYEGL